MCAVGWGDVAGGRELQVGAGAGQVEHHPVIARVAREPVDLRQSQTVPERQSASCKASREPA